MFTQETLDMMLTKGMADLRTLNVPISDSIYPHVILAKSASFYGECCMKTCELKRLPRSSGHDWYIRMSIFTLNNSEKSVMNTIYHELIHTIEETNGHDKHWKYWATYAGQKLGYNICRCGGDKTVQDSRNLSAGKRHRTTLTHIRLTCKHCGVSWDFHRNCRATEAPELCICRVCGGKGFTETIYAKPLKKYR